MFSFAPALRLTFALALGFGALASAPQAHAVSEIAPTFLAAQPVWLEGREREMNLTVGFAATIQKPAAAPVTLRLTGATLYRIWINGEFAGHGPARAAHGFYRVDELDLTARLHSGDNVIAIEVAGYNANSYYVLNQPSFLQAEVVAGDQVLAATSATAGTTRAFTAHLITERVQKVARYSFQRPFTEVWRLTPGWDAWRTNANSASTAATSTAATPAPFSAQSTPALAVQPLKTLLARGVPYSRFEQKSPARQFGAGSVELTAPPEKIWKDRALTKVGPTMAGFLEADLTAIPSIELQSVRTLPSAPLPATVYTGAPVTLLQNSWATFDLGVNRTGFIGAHLEVRQPTRLFFAFDEILVDGDVDFKRNDTVNVVAYEFAPGSYDLETFEPYTFRYLKLIVLAGDCSVSKISLREFTNPDAWRAQFASSDPRLDRIFTAAQETFSQNAVDIFMDCPSRERAGWLCDSLFAARVAQDLIGTAVVEKNFLQNYLLPATFAHLPPGMLPMCYPADHDDGIYIPNWSLWFVLQLEEYAQRSGDRATVAAFRPRLHALLDYFKPYENSDGLLEKLQSWVFVEWSQANKFTQDVSYPTNMLYASALAAMARLYDEPALAAQAEQIRAVIRRQSFDGEFFVDNALRRDG